MNLLAAFTLASFVAAPVPKGGPVPDDWERLQGEWKVVEFTSRGRASPVEQLARSKFTITEGKMEIRLLHWDEKATYNLDPKAGTPAIDLTLQDSGSVGKGIYKLENDRLTLCLGMVGTDRPKEFKSPPDSLTVLIILDRVKK